MYRVTPMLEAYVGEDRPGNAVWGRAVRYLSEGEREAYRLRIQNGRIYDMQGHLFDTRTSSTLFSGAGRAIFVMDAEGHVYASRLQQVGAFHHSSLTAGAPVAAAGEIAVEDGVLNLLSDKSGHYRPSRDLTEQVIERLAADGVDVRHVVFEIVAKPQRS